MNTDELSTKRKTKALNKHNVVCRPTELKFPDRIQRKRVRGWKNPKNTVYVGRPTKWGNPFKVGMIVGFDWVTIFDPIDVLHYFTRSRIIENNEEAVRLFAKYAAPRLKGVEYHLNGKNLSCFCPIGQPCHADVLLKMANRYKHVVHYKMGKIVKSEFVLMTVEEIKSSPII
jgi:hypothetical protein